jgi:hypothetical protein
MPNTKFQPGVQVVVFKGDQPWSCECIIDGRSASVRTLSGGWMRGSGSSIYNDGRHIKRAVDCTQEQITKAHLHDSISQGVDRLFGVWWPFVSVAQLREVQDVISEVEEMLNRGPPRDSE